MSKNGHGVRGDGLVFARYSGGRQDTNQMGNEAVCDPLLLALRHIIHGKPQCMR
jgi:hypothetical protein